MANKVLHDEMDGTPAQITLADIGADFNPTAANDLRHATATDTEVQLDLTSLADGAYRQSAKFDFGAVRAPAYHVRAAIEWAAGVAAGDLIEIYVAFSQHSTAGTANPAGLSGADAAYAGYNANADASIKQVKTALVGVATADATGTIQIMEFGTFNPLERYGIVVVSATGNALHSDAVEMHIVLDPIFQEIQ